MSLLDDLWTLQRGDVVYFGDSCDKPRLVSKIITCKFSGSLDFRSCEKCPGEVVFDNVITHSRCLGLIIEPYVQFTSVCHVCTIDLDSEFEELLNI